MSRITLAPTVPFGYTPASGFYFQAEGNVSGVATVLDRLYFMAMEFGGGFIQDRITCRVTTGGAGSVVRLGIYLPASNGYPGNLLLEAPSTIDGNSATNHEITISQYIPPGRIWYAGVAQGGVAPAMSSRAVPTFPVGNGFMESFTAGVGPANTLGALFTLNHGTVYQAGVAGALPAVATPGYDTTVTNSICIGGRAA